MRPIRPRSSIAFLAVCVALGGYLLAARLWGVSDSFVLMRDQIRDWRFALGPFSALPLTGTQSTAGGSSFGPIYYWLLWIIRHLVGPFTGYQPHAGAIGLSLLQTAADLVFFYAIGKRFNSLWLALTTTLLVGTSSHDLAVEAVMWNPAVSVAGVKLAMAAVLLEPPLPSLRRTVVVTMAAWCAVQAHTAAIFIAAPILGSYVLRDAFSQRISAAAQRMRAIIEVILILQLPFLYYMFTSTTEAVPMRAIAGAAEGLRVRASFDALLNASARIVEAPWFAHTSVVGGVIVGCAVIVMARARKDLRLLSVTVLPVLCTGLGLSVWQGSYDEYWYLPLAPCVALMVMMALSAFPAKYAAPVLLAVVLAVQPWRLAHSRTWYRMPEYRALSHGARTIYRQARTVRRIDTSFPMPPLSDAGFVYEAMGGVITDAAEFDATIDAHGDVRFSRVAR
ncbi:MAG: hypothetical protein ABL961_04010 [Vicinamibacterales bacterium]